MINKNDIPEGYTSTELGIFPEEWQIVAISDIAEKMRAGGTPSRKNPEYWGGSIHFVLIEDMTSVNLFLDKTKETINEAGLQNSSAWIVPSNSLLLSMYATIGATAINTIPMATNQAILAIIPKPNFDLVFGAYVLQFHSSRLASQNVQSTQKNVNKGIVSSFKIPLPPLPEQHAIATTLRTVQEAKENTDAVIAATKALKAAMMKHLFTYGPVHPEDAERVALIETEIGPVPEGWRVAKFSDVVDIAKGQIDPTTDPYNKLLHIGPENIISGTGQVIRMRTAEEINLISGQFYFTSEHVIYSKIRPYLKKVAYPKIEGTCSADMYPLKPQDARLFSEFLFQYLLSDQFSNSAISFQDRTGIPKINRQQIGMIHLPIPPLTIQKQIATILTAIDQKLAAEQSRKEALDTLFTSLLHDLMTAKIRVNQIAV